jgi:nucleobase:cation symporter-1, NCS1 family
MESGAIFELHEVFQSIAMVSGASRMRPTKTTPHNLYVKTSVVKQLLDLAREQGARAHLDEGVRFCGGSAKVLRMHVEHSKAVVRPFGADDALYSDDLAPTSPAQRNWTTYSFAALWISMAHCIPTYMLASGLIGTGMNWWQALGTILVGNIIVLAPILLNSHPGTRYGIPFPVFARAAYGVFGANVPAMMRALVACGWFGINAWIGGEALHTLFAALLPAWPTLLGSAPRMGHLPSEWFAFLLFWSLNILIVFRGMELLRKVENWAAPYVLVMTALLVVWAVMRAHGLGKLLSEPGKFPTLATFWPVFIPSVTAMIGFWATLSLNMPDFTRFGRSQREQTLGQVLALPTTMTVFSAMGVLITSASAEIYGEAIWDPVKLVGRFESRFVVGVAMFTVVVATIGVNIAANVVSPANDFVNIAPKHITFRKGGLITGIVGILMMPWKLLADPHGYIFSWLIGYSGGLAAIAGVLITDYWVLRKRTLDVAALYRREGIYSYGSRQGTNWAAVVATAFGAGLAWSGAFFPSLHFLFDYAWFVGIFASAGLAMRMLHPTHFSRLNSELSVQ